MRCCPLSPPAARHRLGALALTLLVASTAACSSGDAEPVDPLSALDRDLARAPGAPSEVPDGPVHLDELTAAALADARDGASLVSHLRDPSLDTRRRAVWAISRLHDPSAVLAALPSLSDADPELRYAVSFAVGALERDAPPTAVDALLGAYAVEPADASLPGVPFAPPLVVSSVRAVMLYSLARTGDDRVLPALQRGLDEDSESRVAVCRALAIAPDALFGAPDAAAAALLQRAVGLAAEDPSLRVREACLQGLSRRPLPPALVASATSAAVEALHGVSLDDDAVELRVQAARLLGRLDPSAAGGDALRAALADPAPRVVVQALFAIGAWAARGAYETTDASTPRLASPAAALGEVFLRVVPAERADVPAGLEHAQLLSLFEAARPLARREDVAQLAVEWQSRVTRIEAPADPPSRLRLGWLQCRTAQLFDLGRSWLSRVERCAPELLDDDTRRVLSAEVLERATGADPQRATYLRRLFREGGPRAKQAALAATRSFREAYPLELLASGLSDPDLGVNLAALEALAERAPSARRARDEAAVRDVLTGQAQGAPPRLFAALDAELRALTDRVLASDSLEARVTLATTLGVIEDPSRPSSPSPFEATLRSLAVHPSRGVREAARSALTALEVTFDHDAPIDSVPDPSSTEALSHLPRALRVETSEGAFELELFRELAPVTIARLAALAEAGFYDGLGFHRVIPGFVAQGGDPRGDGYGGPDFWLRDELSPVAYERGVVGVALAGPDTGGSQLFITLGAQHHLDGRYTAIGRVRELEAVDRLVVGSQIVRVRPID